jgi:hypothetical protein
MSEPMHHFCNREFIEELMELRERNVLLLLIDGSAVFGRVVNCCECDCVVRLLPPIGITGITNVVFHPSNPTMTTSILVGEVFIDVCDIAHIIEGPFVVSPLVL